MQVGVFCCASRSLLPCKYVSCFWRVCVNVHAYVMYMIFAHTHSRTHSLTHITHCMYCQTAATYTLTQGRMKTYTCAHTYVHMHVSHTNISHTCTQISDSHMHTRIHGHIHTYTYMHINIRLPQRGRGSGGE